MQWSVPARLTRPLRAACSAPALLNSIKRARTRKNGCTRARRADRCTTDADRQAGRQMQADAGRISEVYLELRLFDDVEL